MNDRIPRTIRIDDGWSIPAADGVHRRTLVEGTAWSVPVIAMSFATPAAAASGTPTLKFTKSSYSGKACGTITGVQVKRTTDGTTADSGKTITVTLKDGYTFRGGTTTYSGTTNAEGLISLPDIAVPAKGGNSSFSASSESLSTSAPVAAATETPGTPFSNGTRVTGLPSGVKATQITRENAGGSLYIYVRGDDGLIYRSINSAALTAVTKKTSDDGSDTTALAGSLYASAQGEQFAYISTAGVPYNQASALTGLPKGVKAAQITRENAGDNLYIYVLGDDGLIYRSKNSSALTAVTSVKAKKGSLYTSASGQQFAYVSEDGVPYNQASAMNGLPKGVKATRITRENTDTLYIYVQGDDGIIYRSINSSDLTAVTKAKADDGSDTTALDGSLYASSGGEQFAYVTKAGVPYNQTTALTGLPRGVKAKQITRENAGSLYIYVLADDGIVYRSVNSGALTAQTSGGALEGSLYASAKGEQYAWIGPAC
ncbi:hypothetical protein [Rathayibacter rathayi]|uniref:hypothetical protein n=1 Tax=Rathayibacter rathayi TaxID=33887 RepID=UPI000CE83B4B|nr:hypothetical protein [Rathayibacter rathayi]PPF22986.1 hypothetical protein C5C34_10520 [Rathayibacter rathayi]